MAHSTKHCCKLNAKVCFVCIVELCITVNNINILSVAQV